MAQTVKSERKIRVVLAKGGTDAHTVGIVNLAKSLRDIGMEVIFGGLYLRPEQIVATALEEDADVVGISQLDGNHMGVFTRIRKLLDEAGAKDVLFIGGGVIPGSDVEELKKRGVNEIFLPGTPMNEIVDYINVETRRRQ